MKFVITITPVVRDKGAGKIWNYRPPGFLLRALGGCGRVLVYDYDCDASSAGAKDASHTHTLNKFSSVTGKFKEISSIIPIQVFWKQ